MKLKGVSKIFRNDKGEEIRALDDVSLDIYDLECLSILGPTGCGKTTLLKIIAGIENASEGEIVGCRDRLKTPIVWQEHRLLPWRNVIDNVKLGLELQRRNDEAEEIGKRYLELVGLGKYENYYPHQISGGMQQRVAIARAISFGYDILLLDEPFSSLDYQTKRNLQVYIRHIHRKMGGAIVYVTHIIKDAIFMGDRIVVFTLGPGRIKAIFNRIERNGEMEHEIKEVWDSREEEEGDDPKTKKE